jgi:hypothetical protein
VSNSTGKAVGGGTAAWLIAALIFAAVLYFSVKGRDATTPPAPADTCLSTSYDFDDRLTDYRACS